MNPTNQKLSEIIQKEKPQHYDIFSGIIYYIPQEKSLGKTSDVHRVLYELKQKYNSKSNLLDCFNFSTDGICPVSETLGDTLFGLMLSHIIIIGGKSEFIKNKDANKEIEDKALYLFNKTEKKQLQKMAGDYVKILSEYIK